jgi:hypothetical protein
MPEMPLEPLEDGVFRSPPEIVPVAEVKKPDPETESEKDSNLEAEALTAPFAFDAHHRDLRTTVPRLNLDFIRPKVSVGGEPSILCSQPWTEEKSIVKRGPQYIEVPTHVKEGSSLSISSSSGAVNSVFSKEGTSLLGYSAIGLSSEANSALMKDLSGISRIMQTEISVQSNFSVFQLAKTSRNTSTLEYSSSVPKEPLSLILERDTGSPALDDDEEESRIDSLVQKKGNLSINVPSIHRSETKSSEASTHKFTFRSLTGRAKRTTTIIVISTASKTFLNDYRILSTFQASDQGNLYHAVQSGTNYLIREYSKNSLTQVHWTNGISALDSIRNQIEIQEKLNHPNVLKLLEVIEKPEEDVGYLVFEGALGQAGMRVLSEREAWEVFRQLIRGVNYLHNEAKVVHLGICPEVLLTAPGNVLKISDFSLAQSIRGQEKTLRHVSSPDRIFESVKDLDTALDFRSKPVDIWACGVTLYQLIYGSSPFSDRETSAIYDLIKTER